MEGLFQEGFLKGWGSVEELRKGTLHRRHGPSKTLERKSFSKTREGSGNSKASHLAGRCPGYRRILAGPVGTDP